MFDRITYDFMARFNWNLREIDEIPFPVALELRNRMIEEDRKARKEANELELKSRMKRY